MHLGTIALLKFFEQHREDDSLVLVTIIGTEGSTYRKPGAMMLISQDRQYVGMISGGCLEGDLLHHADDVFATGQARKITYDMHAGDELVWSLGIGCDGIIHLLLQKLDRIDGFPMLDWITSSLAARQAVMLAMKLADDDSGPDLGEPGLGEIGLINSVNKAFGEERLVSAASEAVSSDWPVWRSQQRADSAVLLINMPPQPRVLLCGAGPDAVPVAAQFAKLGWDCIVVDHRSGYAMPERFSPGCETLVSRPEKLHLVLDLQQIDAAVIMAHHLENDAAYLRQLAPLLGDEQSPGNLAYLGVLGPAARRNKLCEMAGCSNALVHGPVGLDIGAELPEAIALSIAAEIHAVLNQRNGFSLTHKVTATL
ncbi:MAG: XdhC family protein [Xanthomonadales bacterium]|nr:XdhC family protein [Xanthomonadales bacterium]